MSRRKERIVIQQNAPTEGAAGDIVDSWSTYCTRWADVETIDGSESIDTHLRRVDRVMKFTVRADSVTEAITESMRAQYDGVDYNITSAVRLDRAVEIEALKVTT